MKPRPFKVTLRRNRDRAEVTHKTLVIEEDEVIAFLYREGNWSCDCNRILDWLRNGGDGQGIDHGELHTCVGGSDGLGQFCVRVRNDKGVVVYEDGTFRQAFEEVP